MSNFDYSVTHLFEDVADTNSGLLRIKTGSKAVDVLIEFASDGQALLEIDAGTVFSDAGTEETVYERNELNDNSATISAYHTPSVDTSGTTEAEDWIPGGGRGANKIGGKSGGGDTLIWKSDTEHLVKITNTSGGASDLFIKVLCREV